MKKLLVAMLVLAMLVFAGCMGASDDKTPYDATTETSAQTQDTSDVADEEDADETTEEKEDEDDNSPDYKIDEGCFAVIGKTVDEVAEAKGPMSESIWANGPIYRFGGGNAWYAFSAYDFDDNNSCVPLGTCVQYIVPLGELLGGVSSCGAGALEDATGKVLSSEVDEMDGGYAFSTSYKGYNLVLYETSMANINQTTMVTISR